MVDAATVTAVVLMVVGVALFALELFHPGALLLIPGSVLLAGGILYLFLPSLLLNSWVGIVVVTAAAVAAALIEIPYYRHVSPGHPPMTTMPMTLVGKEGIVVVDVIPNTLRGKVRVGSEIWSANSSIPISAGTPVRIVSGEGVSIKVVPIASAPAS
ncbi:MAG: NfeD family protein [Candidatus Thermoplasmatota archaeon]|jgi:membrane protein implicated in regulation of membrane protease activity|nr:NfeD family protein [Candidatus Thermoplasmatota archaeon]MCL5983627.1 NfeD family protein [Candidatus Thermoplasmatota archaeon]